MVQEKQSTFDYMVAASRLEEIISKMQSRDVGVDEALALHKEGIALVKEIEQYLTKAEHSIQKLTVAS